MISLRAVLTRAAPLIPACLFVSLGWAEPARGPKTFYQHGFAAAPGYGKAGSVGVNGKGDSAAGVDGGAVSAVPPQAQGDLDFTGASNPQVRANSTGKGDAATKRPKVFVSVFVNSLNREHLQKVIDAAIRLIDRRRAFVYAVYHVGDYRSITPEIEGALKQRGVHLVQSNGASERVQPSVSPLWMISSAEGYHIAEGFSDIDPLLDEANGYDPKRATQPRGDQKMEGF